MKRTSIALFALAAWMLPGAMGQVAKQPQPKSEKEMQVLQEMFGAQDPDSRIKSSEELLTKYADSDFKPVALELITFSYQEKNDFEKMVIYGERTLKEDPQNYRVMLALGQAIAQRTGEFDLDKEEKLGRAEAYAASAEKVVPTLPKPNPQITDEQWDAEKKNAAAQVHDVRGLVAMARKQPQAAVKEFQSSLEKAANPDPATMVRLGTAHTAAGEFDQAIAVLDKVIADPNIPPVFKQFAERQKAETQKVKGQ
jgi:tetratricopeptide (TPR) repeat protein